MLSVHLICVGKLKEKFYLAACAEYQKRLGAYCKLELTELSEERLPQNPSRSRAASIRGKIPQNACLVALCVEGKPHSSEELARLVRTWQDSAARHLVFVIGGSFGLAESLKKEAKVRLSMSPMTFPHHLARVMVLEQIYRAFKINEGSSYQIGRAHV